MKNLILGLIELGMILYLLVVGISIYSITSRKNELSGTLSQVVEDMLCQYYGQNITEDMAYAQVKGMLELRLQSDTDWEFTISSCDMEKGIFGIEVKEGFRLPNGFYRVIEEKKTAIVEGLEEEPYIWKDI